MTLVNNPLNSEIFLVNPWELARKEEKVKRRKKEIEIEPWQQREIFLQNQKKAHLAIVLKMKFCYRRLKNITRETRARTCVKKRACKVCNRKHPTTLPGNCRKKAVLDDHPKKESPSDEPTPNWWWCQLCIRKHWYRCSTALRCRSFSKKVSRKHHLCYHVISYCYFCKSNIAVAN